MTLDCLASLESEVAALPGGHVFLVDNASGDGSWERIGAAIEARCWGGWITRLAAGENGGFSAGNNLALRSLLETNPAPDERPFDAVLLLNSDTVVGQGALRALCGALAEHADVGLIGPRLEWPDGTLQASCFRYISPQSEFLAAARTGPLSRLLRSREVLLERPTESAPIEWISFACVLVRREVFESIGLLDEGYFMYFEDVDFCRRARAKGWSIRWEPAARVVHLRGGVSPDAFERQERKRRPRFYYASRARYLAKFYGPAGPCAANLLWLAGRCVSRLRELAGRPPHTAEHEARDIWTGCWSGRPAVDGTAGQSGRCNASGPLLR